MRQNRRIRIKEKQNRSFIVKLPGSAFCGCDEIYIGCPFLNFSRRVWILSVGFMTLPMVIS